MALHSLTVRNSEPGSPRGELDIISGVVQDTREPAGMEDRTRNIVSAYSKNYDYDQRLMNEWSPGNPFEDANTFMSWNE